MSWSVLSKIKAAFLGIVIGDAMGMPWEIFTRKKILEETNGEGVLGFRESSSRRIKEVRHLRLGDTTDDWQLSKAMILSILANDGFDLYDIALSHVIEHDRNDFGWGGTTRKAIMEFKLWFLNGGRYGRSPFEPTIMSETNYGCGNGVAMKIIPFALYYALQAYKEKDTLKFKTLIEKNIRDLGLMTHPDPRAWISAYALVLLVFSIFFFEKVSMHSLPVKLFEIIDVIKKVENKYCMDFGFGEEDMVSFRLQKLTNKQFLENPDIVRKELGVGCWSVESVPFAIACFMRHSTNFRAGVLEAINAGGDTDSIASMVGALIGVRCGLDAIPLEWRYFCPESKSAIILGRRFYNQFATRKQLI